LWALATCRDARGVLTASNEAQLYTKNRAELTKWHRLFRGNEFFNLTATALIRNDPGHEFTWRLDLLPWNPYKAEAFAGLHNAGWRILIIFDEASAIDPIIETVEPASDVNTQVVWCCFGNPLHNTGPFSECFGKFAHRWKRFHVDSRDVGISDKKQIARCAADYSEDGYFFCTRVRGLFPSAGSAQFIATDLVEAAMVRDVQWMPNDALVLGVDVARFGEDSSVIYPRRGLDARSIKRGAQLSDRRPAVPLPGDFIPFEVADPLSIQGSLGLRLRRGRTNQISVSKTQDSLGGIGTINVRSHVDGTYEGFASVSTDCAGHTALRLYSLAHRFVVRGREACLGAH
jgi:hypothetical protein